MDVKKQIRSELDTLVFTVATTYNEFITEDIPDKQFESARNEVLEATDQTQDNLLSIANKVVEETIKLMEEKKQEKATRLTKLLPETMGTMEPTEIEVAPIMEATPIPASSQLEGPATPLPRDVSGGPSEMLGPPDMDQLVEQAEQAISNTAAGGAGFVDMDESITVDHDLGLTIAEENRLKQGLPAKKKGPTVHVTGKPTQMAPETPAAPTAAPGPSYEPQLRQIAKMVKGHVNSSNEGVAMLAGNILTLIEETLGENFTQAPETNNAE